jgi:hypothetical protein
MPGSARARHLPSWPAAPVTSTFTPVRLSRYGHHAGFSTESATGRQTRAQRFGGPYCQRALHNGQTLRLARARAEARPSTQSYHRTGNVRIDRFFRRVRNRASRWRPGSALAIAEQRDQAARMYREGEVLMAVAVEVAHLHVAIVVREWWKPGFAPA